LDYALNIERSLGYNHVWLVLGIGDKKAAPGSVVYLPASNDTETLFEEIMVVIKGYKDASHDERLIIRSSAQAASDRVARERGKSSNNQV
jgi:hypothetical protein